VTTREKLHRVIDDLPETELDGALELLVSKTSDEPPPERESIVLNDEQAERFLDALDHPERFEPGLRRLMASAGARSLERD
jgi:Protein of unknown function (DUF1778)